METATVYLSALQESLQKKQRIMEELLTLTQQQSEVLQQENMDIDVFEQLMAQKEKALGEINILDKGFDSVYHKVSPYLEQDKQSYRSAILEMQNLIRVITDCGVKIEGLERRNREVFQRYLLKQRAAERQYRIIRICQTNIMHGSHIFWIKRNNKKTTFMVNRGCLFVLTQPFSSKSYSQLL